MTGPTDEGRRDGILLLLAVLAAVAAGSVLAPADSAQAVPASSEIPAPAVGLWEELPSLTVTDLHGLYITRNYRDCDAVGSVIVRGNYDYIERDGQIEVFLGYDGGPNPKANTIYVSVAAAPWCNP